MGRHGTSRDGKVMTAMESKVAMPRPEPDELTRFFWDGVNQHKLLIQRCQDCGVYVHWPKPICTKCLSANLAPSEVSGRGVLYSYGVAMQAFHPGFADKLPYIIAVVELEEQKDLKLVTNIIECPEEEVSVGMPVEVVYREVEEGLTLPLFKPLGQ